MANGAVGSYKIAFSPDLSAFTSVGATISRTLATGVTGGLSAASNGLQSLSSGLGSISNVLDGISSKIYTGLAAGIGVATAAAAKFVPQAIQMSDAEAGFRSTLKFARLSQDEINKLGIESRRYADQTVYDLDDIQSVVAQLSANGVKGAEKIAEAAGNLNAVAGGTKDTYKSVALVITQTQGLGHLNTQNWYQISNAIPGAAGRLQEALKEAGAYTGNFSDALSSSQISAEEFEQAIVKLGDTTDAYARATATDTFSGAFGNLEATVVGGLMDQIDQNKGVLTDFINQLNGPAEKATEVFGRGLSVVTQLLSGQKTATEVLGEAYQASVARIQRAIQTLREDVSGMGGELENVFNGIIGGSLSLKDAFKQLTDILKGHLSTGDIGTIAVGFAAAIPILSKVLSLASLLTGALGGILGVASKASGVVFTVIGGLAKGIGSIFNGSALSGVSRLITSLTAGLSPVVLIIGAVVAAFAAFFTQTQQGQQLWQNLVTTLGQVWVAIQPAIATLISSVQQLWSMIQPALASIWSAMQPILATITQLVIDLLPVLIPIINAIITVVSSAIQIVSTILSAVIPVIQIIIGLISNVISNISAVISTVAQALGPTITRFSQTVISVVRGIRDYISDFVGFFKALFNGDLSGAIAHLGGMFQDLLGIIGSILGPVKNIGINILRGLWSGISSGWEWLTAQLTRFVGNFMRFMRHLFGIGSPSRLMADEVGIWLPRGIGMGIDGASDELMAQADAFSSALSSRLSATASVTTDASGMKIPTSSLIGFDYTRPQTIQPQVTINQEVAKADSAMDVFMQTKRAADGYFARGIVAYPQR